MTRYRIMGLVVLLVVGAQLTAASAGEPITIGTERQLVVDDVLIAAKHGVTRTIHPCKKLPKPVVEPEHPWEGNRVYVYGTVVRDATSGEFRMWYMSNPTQGRRDPRLTWSRGALVLYATSKDGLRWQKPTLGLYAFNGSKANNIVYGMDSPSIIIDADEPDPERRYTMLGYCRFKGHKGSAGAAFSADGIHWTPTPIGPLFRCHDTLTLAHEPETGLFFAFNKSTPEVRGHHRRAVKLTVSEDLKTWSERKLVMVPDEKDDAWASGPQQRTDFYNMSAFPWGDQWLGMVTVFRRKERLAEAVQYQSRDDGPIHVELTHSRDGRTWHRLAERKPIVPNGPHGYDAGCILGLINTPVVVGDEVWMYYTAITTTHGGRLPTKRITIARAAWRLDGFVSLDAGGDGGVIETKTLRPEGDRLVVNADASKGSIAVEVLDASGEPLPGYARADAVVLKSDAVRHPIRWRGHDRLPSGEPLRLRFHLHVASLFSFAMVK